MILEDKLANQLRKGEISPEGALALMQNNEVRVYDVAHAPVGADWAEVEDAAAGGSGLFHAFLLAGGAQFADDLSNQIARLRAEGLTVESLWANPT